MSRQLPDFDPFELLGLDASADGATVDRAYKARIRHVHPDIAGVAGLDETKRLNIAREWLLDADLRAQLPPPSPRWGAFRRKSPRPPKPSQPSPKPSTTTQQAPPRPPTSSTDTDWFWEGKPAPPPKSSWDYEPDADDPLVFDFGVASHELLALFETIRGLSADERARVTYSLGEEPPLFFDDFEEIVGERLWARSRALEDAVEQVWRERVDEGPPLLFPRGRVFGNGIVVINAYAQWRLLREAISQKTRDPLAIAALDKRCTAAWAASVGHQRFGTYQDQVVSCLDAARRMTLTQAVRLSRAWERDMGGFLFGRPGEDWFPGLDEDVRPDLVSARLAAVDASRVDPPDEMPFDQRNGFRCGLRLSAYMLALGGVSESGRDYLRPWTEALDPNPSFRDRARWGLPKG
jgi:hypothetical protein